MYGCSVYCAALKHTLAHAHHMRITCTYIRTYFTCITCTHHMHITCSSQDALNCCNNLTCCFFGRSTSVISRLNKSSVESIDTLAHSSPSLSAGTDAVTSAAHEEDQGGLNSPSVVTLGSLTSAKPGQSLSGYLGLFSQQGKGTYVCL